ncbi:hypothetical protein [Hankyongella ginsenosidimutans]
MAKPDDHGCTPSPLVALTSAIAASGVRAFWRAMFWRLTPSAGGA